MVTRYLAGVNIEASDIFKCPVFVIVSAVVVCAVNVTVSPVPIVYFCVIVLKSERLMMLLEGQLVLKCLRALLRLCPQQISLQTTC